MKISIPLTVLNDDNITHTAMMLYPVLRNTCRQEENLTSRDVLCLYMFGKITQANRTAISDGLADLAQYGFIHLIDMGNNIYNITKVERDMRDKFVSVVYEDLITIMRSETKHNTVEMAYYYCKLVSTFNPYSEPKYIMGEMAISYLAKFTHKSQRVILSYHKHLEKIKVLYIHHGKRRNREGNWYCRYEDKSLVLHIRGERE